MQVMPQIESQCNKEQQPTSPPETLVSAPDGPADIHRVSRVRLQFLSEEIYKLGPHPLYHLLAEIVDGAQPAPRIERYARLSRELGQFIHALGGDQFSDRLLVIDGEPK
jgi:hypothetical protein